ncbi:hypothetical protein [Salipiger thiooxidans]|uniref:hypothetical protein n=1 Tax=Salipiger thiooxidans TaxID=282683 RepID=UPI001CD446D2|nr:hypothetical protein [Salipiger thiooxidans]MCA0846072.1 hypothetical protein [Salipiger thiooxidans]
MSTDTKSVERLAWDVWNDPKNAQKFREMTDAIKAIAAERDAATARVAELEARLAEARNAVLLASYHDERDGEVACAAIDALLAKKESRDE